MATQRRCVGCGIEMPEINLQGRYRRRDARYHDDACRKRITYVQRLIRHSALTGKPLPEWVLR